VPGATALRTLSALEAAYERLVLAMRLTPPRPDRGGGGSDGLDLYLVAANEPDLVVGHDRPELGSVDRAPAFCVLRGPDRTDLTRAASQCVAEAIAIGLDAAESPHLRRAYASELWLQSGHPAAADLAAIDDVQSAPERAIAQPDRSSASEGAALLFDHLERSLGRGDPGTLATSLLALAAGRTAPEALWWDDEPDVFDVLRHNLDGDPRRMSELLADFAADRALLGDRDDGSHFPELGWVGAAGRLRFDWVIDFSSLPRRVASTRPVEPTGAMAVWLTLGEVPKGATLAAEFEWEAPVEFAWVLVRIGPDGREIGRSHVAYRQQSTRAESTLENLPGTSAVIVVGTNLGGVDASHPFDPDIAPFEAEGCTVYLARM
jgi:hypothetical protein